MLKKGTLINMFELKNSSLMEKSLDALWLRLNVISNNIANVDTPGFKSSGVIFEELLNDSMLETSDNRKACVPEAKIFQTDNVSIREDGNNVDIDKENIELYRVQIQYEYMIRKISDQYSNLEMVLREGK